MSVEMKKGRYRGIVTESGVGQTAQDFPQVAVAFKLPDLGDQVMTWYGYFTDNDKAVEMAERGLDALGFNLPKEGYAIDRLVGDDSPILGVEAEVVVDYNPPEGEYDGKWVIKFINRPGGLALRERANAEKAKSLGDSLRARFGGGTGTKPVAVGDDEPPF